MKFIDAHTHIDYITPDLQKDVVGAICCATKESEWKKIIDLMNSNNTVYGAFGVHPWFVDNVIDGLDDRLQQLLKNDSNYMVGEIGLDKNKPNMEKQIDLFIKQFELAIDLERVVSIHCVGAWDKMLYVLKQYKQSELPLIIVHGFNENEQILKQLLQYKNIYFSLNKNAVYGKNCRIDQIPNDNILIETDGKSDVLLVDLCDAISQIKNESNLSMIIYNNAQRLLNNG